MKNKNKPRQRIYRKPFYPGRRIRARRASRDYYRSPFAQRNSKFLGTLMVIVLLLGLVWFFLCSQIFSIDKILVTGVGELASLEIPTISQQEITNIVQEFLTRNFFIFKEKNFFLLNSKNLKEVLETLPLIEKAEIAKIFPDELRIEVKPRLPQAIFSWQSPVFDSEVAQIRGELAEGQSKHYWLDHQGLIIQELPEIEREVIVREGKLLLIYDKRGLSPSGPQPEEALQFILGLVNKLAQKTDQFKIVSVEIIDVHEIHLITSEGWRAYFDLSQDRDTQVDNLIMVLSEKIKNRENLEYIDLRFGSKIYYKNNPAPEL